jgi:hypothetical protein
MEVSGQLNAPVALPPGKEPPSGTTWIGGWVGTTTIIIVTSIIITATSIT